MSDAEAAATVGGVELAFRVLPLLLLLYRYRPRRFLHRNFRASDTKLLREAVLVSSPCSTAPVIPLSYEFFVDW